MTEDNAKNMETFDLELPDELIEKCFGLGFSDENLAKKLEAFLIENITKEKPASQEIISDNSLDSQPLYSYNGKKILGM